MGVALTDLFDTLQVYMGGYYVNDFNRFGRTWQVNVQAEQNFRAQIDDLKQLKVRSDNGQMVPFGSFATVKDITGPVLINRYNMYESAPINYSADSSISSGQAIDLMQGVVDSNLTWSMRGEWTELALLQLQTGNTAMWVFVLAVVLVFLVLAAQYESWNLPLAVVMIVPMCLLASVTGLLMRSMAIDVLAQIGFVVLVGLAAKNAILIVEFARQTEEAGATRFHAAKTHTGSRRLRHEAADRAEFRPLQDIDIIRRVGCLAGHYLGSRRSSRSRRA
jgi:multidrug efflux pump subunit AcrB